MGVVLSLLLYALTAALVTLGARRLTRVPLSLAFTFSLLPLLFTAGGYLPGKVLAPTNTLNQVAPWLDPDLTALVVSGSTPQNPLLYDPLSQMLPWSAVARDHLLFNPHLGSGSALLANGQSALLFPSEILSRLLPPVRAVAYSQSTRLLLALWGLFLLARALPLTVPASALAALAYLGAGYLHLWRLHPHSLVAATAPWILLALLHLIRRPGPLPALALAVTGALGLYAGHPETLLKILLLSAPLSLSWLLSKPVRERSEGPSGEPRPEPVPPSAASRPRATSRFSRGSFGPLPWAALALLLSVLLSAPLLLPFTENLLASSEWHRRDLAQVQLFEVPLTETVARLAPTFVLYAFGDPVTTPAAVTTGPDNVAELGGGSLGLAALLLAALALAGPRRREALPWLLSGLFFLLVSAKTPFLSAPFEHLPILSITLLTRLNLCWALCAAVLVGYGAEAIFAPRRPSPVLITPLHISGIALLLAVPAAVLLALQPLSRAFTGAPLELAALAAATLLLLVAARRAAPASLPILLLLALVLLAPRVLQFARWIPTASVLSYYPDSLGLRFVAEQDSPPGTRIAGIGQALFAGTASLYGLEDVRINDPVSFHPYDRFLAALGEVRRIGGLRLLDPDHPALDFLGVGYFFDHPQMGHRPGLEAVYLGQDALIHRNPGALPRVYVPRRFEAAADEATAAALALGIDDFAERVSTHAPSPIPGPLGLPEPGAYPNAPAHVTDLVVDAGRLRATVEAEATALVATSQPAIPGWILLRDDRPADPIRINGAFLGALVPAGTTRLEWVYRPRSWTWGCGLFGIGLVLGSGLGWWGRRAAVSRTGGGGTTSASD